MLASAPLCGPCCECEIGTDLFDGALSAWTQVSGTWSTAGGLLTHTGAGLLLFNTAAASASSAVHVVTFPDVSTTGKLRLIAAYYDADNYLFGELEYSANTIRLGQRRLGVERWLTTAKTITPAARPTLSLCWVPGEVQEEIPGVSIRLPTVGENSGGAMWTSPENITAVDAASAQYLFTLDEEESGLLEGNTFGFTIPSGSDITEIYLAIVGQKDPGEFVAVQSLDLIVTGFAPTTPGFAETQLPQPEGGVEFSGTITDWNVSAIEPSDVNSDEFGGVLECRQTEPPGTSQAQINWMVIQVGITTPPRGGGRLTMSYDGECIRAFGVHAHESGLKAAIAVVSGSWDFTEFTYSYHESASRPTCPGCECISEPGQVCTVCCDPDFPPADAYTVDLTGLSLADNGCDCTFQVGAFVVESGGSCEWEFLGSIPCDAPLNIALWSIKLKLINDGMGCKWQARIEAMGTTVQDPGDVDSNSGNGTMFGGLYESAYLGDEEDCQTMPVTLNKIFGGVGSRCTGAAPATIGLDLA